MTARSGLLLSHESEQCFPQLSPELSRGGRSHTHWRALQSAVPLLLREPTTRSWQRQYSSRFYEWAKKYVEAKTKTTKTNSLEELRRVLGLESVKDAEGNVIHEAPMPVWANFRQRALDVAILEINAKTDLKIKLVSIERSKHRRVVALDFLIKTQTVPKARTKQ
jgi:hypothetical protein